MTPEQRSMRARLAAHARWARTPAAERAQATAAARRTRRERWAAEIDPDGVLPPAELARRLNNRQAEHMARMCLASSRARRKTA